MVKSIVIVVAVTHRYDLIENKKGRKSFIYVI